MLMFKNKKLKDENNKTIHDTEKPVEMMELLVKNSSEENDIIFDPFMGLGGVGLATLNNSRKFIGIELDEKYFKIDEERTYNN